MKFIVFVIFILALLILSGAPSSAEVYKWVDEKGRFHFTDDATQIPVQFRPTMEKMEAMEEKGEIKVGSPASAKTEEPHGDRLGRDEAYWKARVGEWDKKLKVLQEKVETLRNKYNELTERHNDSKVRAERMGILKDRERVKADMDQYRAQIEEARDMLEKKIPEEAELDGAKPEWLRN